jgi:hypothetical protein
METIDKLNGIFNLITEIKGEDEVLGTILLNNFGNIINGIDAAQNNKDLEISQQIEMISALLGLDLEAIVKHIIETDYGMDQNGDLVNAEEADKESIDFILGNINNTKIDDYEQFLEDNNVKENMEFLKGEL